MSIKAFWGGIAIRLLRNDFESCEILEKAAGQVSPRIRALMAVLLVVSIMLGALSASLYLDAKHSKERIADSQDEIIIQLGLALGGIQSGIPLSLDDNLTSMERFGMASVVNADLGTVYLTSIDLAAMYDPSDWESEVLEALGGAAGRIGNVFYNYVYKPLLDNLTSDSPLQLNSTVVPVLLGIMPNIDDIAYAVRILDPDTLKAGVSLMDLDAIFAAVQEITDELEGL